MEINSLYKKTSPAEFSSRQFRQSKYIRGLLSTTNLSRFAILPGLLLVGLSISAVQTSYAADQHWDGNNTNANGTVNGGGGIWNDNNTNWTTVDGATNSTWSSGNTAIFSGAAGGTVFVTDPMDVGRITFKTNDYELSQIGSGRVNLSSPRTVITADPTISAEINTTIIGDADSKLVKAGTGTVILSRNNDYLGGTEVTQGTLKLEGNGTLGAETGATQISGGTLDLGRTEQNQNSLDISGGLLTNGQINVDSAIISGNGEIGESGIIHATTVISQRGGTMDGTAETKIYNLSAGTMSGTVTATDDFNQSNGTLSGKADTKNYNLFGNGQLTGKVSSEQTIIEDNASVVSGAELNADNFISQRGGTMAGTATTKIYNLSAGTMSGTVTATDDFNQSSGILSGTATTENYSLFGNGLLTGTVNSDQTTIAGNAIVASGAILNADNFISQQGGTMAGTAETQTYNLSAGTMVGTVKSVDFNQSNGTLSGTANTTSYDLFGNGRLTGTVNADEATIDENAVVSTTGKLTVKNSISQDGGTMAGTAETDTYNLSAGTMVGTVKSIDLNQSGGTLSGTANTADYDLSGNGNLTGTVNSGQTILRGNAFTSTTGKLNATNFIWQQGGTMAGTADTPEYNLSGGNMSGTIINGVDVNHWNGRLSGVANTTNYDLAGTGVLSGQVNAKTVTVNQSAIVEKNGRLNAEQSVTQSGGTMGGTANTALYNLAGGTMSGSVNAVDVKQSKGTLSGRSTSQTYDLSGGRVSETGIVNAWTTTLRENGIVEKGGRLVAKTSITQSGGVMAGVANAPIYDLSRGTMQGSIVNATDVNHSGGILSGTAQTKNYDLSGTGFIAEGGVVNANTATINDNAEVSALGTLNAQTSISQTGGRMRGVAKTAKYAQSGGSMSGQVETNNYVLSDGNASGKVTAYREFSLTGQGNFTGETVTNVFKQSGGIMQGAVTSNGYILSGGTLLNSNRVTTKAFGQTGGDLRGDIVADIKARAMNGTISALSSNGVNVSNNGNGVAISTTSNGTIINKTGIAITASETTGNINIVTAGGISGTTGINANTSGKGNVNIVANNTVLGTTGAAIAASSVGGNVSIAGSGAISGNAFGVLAKSQNGNIFVKTDNTISGNNAIALETTGAGKIELDLGGIVAANDTAISLKGEKTNSHAMLDHEVRAGKTALRSESAGLVTFDNFSTIRSTSGTQDNFVLLDNVAGNTILNNHSGGLMGGVLSSGTGATTTINNMAGGVWNVNNSGISNLLGSDDVIQNSGLINITGDTKFNGLETFRNQAGGNLSLTNDKVGDHLTLSGNYVGSAGSDISLDVDFDKGTSDVVTLGGVLMGTTNIKVNALTTGQDPSAFGQTILLVDVPDDSGGGELTATGLPTGGVVQYNLIRQDSSNGGSRYVVRSGIDGEAASGVVSGFIAAQNVIASSFFKPSSGLISAPVDPDKNQFGLAPWIRTNGGLSRIKTNGTITQADGTNVDTPATVETSYYGYQVGLDGGIFNIQDTDANVNFGVTGGQIFGKTDQKNYSNTTDFTSVFYGAYAAYTKGPWFVDVQVRQELMDYTINVSDPIFRIDGEEVNGDRVSISGSTSYTFAHNDWAFIPATGFTYSKSSTDDLVIPRNVLLNQNEARVRFADVESMIGFGGITVSKNFFFDDDRVRISPFVTVTGYHDFAGDINATLTVDPNSSRPIVLPVKTERLQTYGEASFGVNLLALTGKINGVERLVIGSLRGDAQFGKDIVGGSMTAQFRVQF